MRSYPVVPQYHSTRLPLHSGLHITTFVDVIIQELEDGFFFSSVLVV